MKRLVLAQRCACARAQASGMTRVLSRSMHLRCDESSTSKPRQQLLASSRNSTSKRNTSSSTRRMGASSSSSSLLTAAVGGAGTTSDRRSMSASAAVAAFNVQVAPPPPSPRSTQQQSITSQHVTRPKLLERFHRLLRQDKPDQVVQLVQLVRLLELQTDDDDSHAKRMEIVDFWGNVVFKVFRMRRWVSDSAQLLEKIWSCLRENDEQDALVAEIVGNLVNGCAKAKKFDEANDLVLLYLGLDTKQPFPANVLGNLISKMMNNRNTNSPSSDSVLDALRFVHTVTTALDPDERRVIFPAKMFVNVFGQLRRMQTIVPADHSEVDAVSVSELVSLHKWIDLLINNSIQWCQDPTTVSQVRFEQVFGSAMNACLVGQEYELVVRLYEHLIKSKHARLDESIYVSVFKALDRLHYLEEFKQVYDHMIVHARQTMIRSQGREGVDEKHQPEHHAKPFVLGQPTIGSALHFACRQRDIEFLERIADDLLDNRVAKTRTPFIQVAAFNHVLDTCLQTQHFQFGREFYDHFKHCVLRNENSLVTAVRLHRVNEIFELLSESSDHEIPRSPRLYQNILKICKLEGCLAEARMVLQMMQVEQVQPTLKGYQYLAFLYAKELDFKSIIELVSTLQHQKHMQPTKEFFDDVLHGFSHGQIGLKPGFAFLQEMMQHSMRIPRELYDALLAAAASNSHLDSEGIVQAIDLAYQMECEGMTLHEDQLIGLIDAIGNDKDLIHLVQVFELLHQGNVTDQPYDGQVYLHLWHRVQQADRQAEKLRAKVKSLAQEAGYQVN